MSEVNLLVLWSASNQSGNEIENSPAVFLTMLIIYKIICEIK